MLDLTFNEHIKKHNFLKSKVWYLLCATLLYFCKFSPLYKPSEHFIKLGKAFSFEFAKFACPSIVSMPERSVIWELLKFASPPISFELGKLVIVELLKSAFIPIDFKLDRLDMGELLKLALPPIIC